MNDITSVVQELSKLDGMGPRKARELALAGATLNSLKQPEFARMLPIQTRIAVCYKLEDIISRDLAEKIISKLPQHFIGVGSYRRNKATLGDIDLLTQTPLEDAVKDIQANLNVIGEYASGERKHSTVIEFEDKYIRMDVFYATAEEWPFALLHFTGSKEFNIRVRAQAKRQGCKLSQYGLECNGNNLIFKDEKSILEHIGVTYVDPESRNE